MEQKAMLRLMAVASMLIAVVFVSQKTTVFGQTRLLIDPRVTHQSIDGFGASDAWTVNPMVKKWIRESNDRAIEELADLLFSTKSGIGLSAWRFNIGAGSSLQGVESLIPDPLRRGELFVKSPFGPIDESQHLGQLRMLREAHQRGVADFVAFANSPPYWATKNGLTHPNDGQDVGSSNLDPKHRQAFAKSLVDVIMYLRGPKVGVPVNYISPLNEPTWDWQGKTQEGCPYNIEDIKELYRSVHAQLIEAGISNHVHVDGPESVEYTAALSDANKIAFDKKIYQGGMHSKNVGRYRNYIDEFLGDPEMRSLLQNKISMHGYFSDAWPDRLGKLRDITFMNVKQVSPNAKIWMSEFCILGDPGKARSFGGPSYDAKDMEFAIHLATVMHRDLTRLNVSAWHWWLAITPYEYKDGLLKVSPSLDSDSVEPTKAFWAFGNFSRFVRPGFTRVQVTNPDELDGLMVSAYKSSDASTIALVIVNGARVEKSLTFELEGSGLRLDRKTIQVFTTDQNHDLQIASMSEELSVSPRSITTVVIGAVKN
jgi:O-glycosyl hydrolase